MPRLVAFVLAAALTAASASATVITFTDRSAFIAATGASAAGAIPSLPTGTEFSLGPLDFKNVSPSSLNTTVPWSTLISEPNDLAINDVEDFDVLSTIPIFAFGFDFHEPSITRPPGPRFPDTCNTATCVDSTFQIQLFSGATLVATHLFTRPDDVLTFVGIWTSSPFDRIEIRETVGINDNEFFGNFLFGTTPVPEPTSLALLGAGLLGLGVIRRRQS